MKQHGKHTKSIIALLLAMLMLLASVLPTVAAVVSAGFSVPQPAKLSKRAIQSKTQTSFFIRILPKFDKTSIARRRRIVKSSVDSTPTV